MMRGELESPPAHLLIVLEIRPAATPPAMLDKIREDAAEPERVIAHVRSHQECSAGVVVIDVARQLRERIVYLVIVRRDAVRPIAETEVQHDGADVVRQSAVSLACP